MEQTVKLPKCWRTLHPRFFQERVDMPVRGHDCEGHVKAFSNEVLAGTRIRGQWLISSAIENATAYSEMLETVPHVYDLFLIGNMPADHANLLSPARSPNPIGTTSGCASFTAHALSVKCPMPPLALNICIWSQYISICISDSCLA